MIKTAECVSPMHPDKMCDRISDTLLDLYLQGDPNSRVAIETCGGNGKVFITGEVTSNTEVSDDDIKSVVYDISGVTDVIIQNCKFNGNFRTFWMFKTRRSRNCFDKTNKQRTPWRVLR